MNIEPLGRILFLTSSFPRWQGDSTAPFLLHLAQDLQELGWSVDVHAPHAPGIALQETLSGIHVQRFRYFWPKTSQTLCYQGGALTNLRDRPLGKLKIPPFLLCEWASVLHRLRRGSYDLLHCHWILPQGFVGALASRQTGIPYVATVHGSDVLTLRGPVVDYCKRIALRNAAAITVNSSATRQSTEQLLPNLSTLQTIPMGITEAHKPSDFKVSALRRRYRREPGPLLVYAGRVIHPKGVGDLVSAVNLLRPKMPGVTALIVGEGSDRTEIEANVDKIGLRDHIYFAGGVDPSEVPNYMAAGDVFVGPSWQEGQGLVFAEAMLAGLPVIATDVGGVSDTVRHDSTGLLVRERAPAEIAAAVERLSNDPGLGRRLADAGKSHVLGHLLRSHTAAAFSGLFSDIISKDRSQLTRHAHSKILRHSDA